MTDTNFTFPKLNAFNYNIWKVDMKVLLIDRGSWDFIIEDEPDLPAEATAKDIREFKWRKDRAFTTIYQGVERKYQTLIANAADGKEAWYILKQNFEPNSRARLAGLIDEFYELKFAPDEETIGIFIKRVQEKKQLIKEAGFDLPEVLVCFQLIRKLPQDYDGIVQVLYRLEEKHFNVENIEAHLITESGRVQQKKKDDGLDIVSNAYQTKTPRMYQGNKKKNYFSAKAQYSSGSMLEPTVHPRTARTYDIRNCSFCGKTGHLIKDCFLRNKNSQWQHYRNDQNYRGKSSAFHSEILRFHHISERASDPTSELGEWLIDSAATSHFCKEKDWFVNYQDIPPMDALIGDVDCKSTFLGEIVQNIVKSALGLRSYRLYCGKTLYKSAMKNRLDKAKKLFSMIRVGRLSDIVWTDENIFTVEVAHNSQNHPQLLPPGNKASRKRRVHTRLKFPKSVMVWAGVISEGKTPLVFIDRNVKIVSHVYQDVILRDCLLPWARQHFAGRNFILQQDHGSQSTIAFCQQPGFLGKDIWPSNSPDLNPMDRVELLGAKCLFFSPQKFGVPKEGPAVRVGQDGRKVPTVESITRPASRLKDPTPICFFNKLFP
ncbi:hypothetical protein LAZ67_1003572 [Cordylochernes scorpioides]|uniref:CCHC-type domain-containing protein n=1 Tax=Cordylochernes scorpioides TaxID=51811 RepID=A0ABY6JX13_9ARAC|nr:hypothetical protein LAZ67_1003572 [Cordylochernes scorpioides]